MPYVVLLTNLWQKGPKTAIFLEILTFFNRLYLGDGLSDPFEIWHAYRAMLYTSTCTVRFSQFQF